MIFRIIDLIKAVNTCVRCAAGNVLLYHVPDWSCGHPHRPLLPFKTKQKETAGVRDHFHFQRNRCGDVGWAHLIR